MCDLGKKIENAVSGIGDTISHATDVVSKGIDHATTVIATDPKVGQVVGTAAAAYFGGPQAAMLVNGALSGPTPTPRATASTGAGVFPPSYSVGGVPILTVAGENAQAQGSGAPVVIAAPASAAPQKDSTLTIVAATLTVAAIVYQFSKGGKK